MDSSKVPEVLEVPMSADIKELLLKALARGGARPVINSSKAAKIAMLEMFAASPRVAELMEKFVQASAGHTASEQLMCLFALASCSGDPSDTGEEHDSQWAVLDSIREIADAGMIRFDIEIDPPKPPVFEVNCRVGLDEWVDPLTMVAKIKEFTAKQKDSDE